MYIYIWIYIYKHKHTYVYMHTQYVQEEEAGRSTCCPSTHCHVVIFIILTRDKRKKFAYHLGCQNIRMTACNMVQRVRYVYSNTLHTCSHSQGNTAQKCNAYHLGCRNTAWWHAIWCNVCGIQTPYIPAIMSRAMQHSDAICMMQRIWCVYSGTLFTCNHLQGNTA